MEKKARFPHSRELFLFAKKVLAHRQGYGDPARIPDFAVGQLLGFSRDLTSRFKTGDRNYTDAAVIMQLARQLMLDSELLLRVAGGELEHRRAFRLFQQGAGGAELKNKRGKVLARLVNCGMDSAGFSKLTGRAQSLLHRR